MISGRERVERRLAVNRWNELWVTDAAAVGCVNRTLDAVPIARRDSARLPASIDAVVYRPHWFHPAGFCGTAEPYDPDDRSLRARFRRVPPPPS